MATTSDNFVYKTNPDPYAQAIFLSQKAINNSFSRMWELAQLEPDDPDDPFKNPLKYFDWPTRTDEYFRFKTGKPTVRLQVTTNGDPMLYFRLRMDEGGMFIFTSQDPRDDEHIEWEIDNWVFAFSVKISRKEITKESEEYKEFKERAGLPNSNFTLAVLFIDASTTTTWSDELSDFGDKEDEWRKLTAVAKGRVKTFIQEWLNITKEAGQNILGYSAERQEDDDLNEYAPSFPPTSIDYWPYPWRGSDGSQDPQDNLDSNALSYLMMCDFESPPTGGVIDYSGPWVDDGDREGTFVMNRNLFQPWLHGLLRQIVIGMVPYPDKPYCEYRGDYDLPFSSGMRFHAGDDEAEKNEYQFKPSQSDPNTYNLWGETRESQAYAVHGEDSDDTMTLTEKCQPYLFALLGPTASAKCYPGEGQIDVNGRSYFTFNATHKTKKRETYTDMTFSITWSMSLSMASVEDGGLQIGIVQDSEKVEVDHSVSGGMHWSRDPADIAEDWKEEIQNGMKTAISKVKNSLLYGLADHQRLFLPGKGSYLMKDPIFSSRGDLLVDLKFNGADPPKQKKRHLHLG